MTRNLILRLPASELTVSARNPVAKYFSRKHATTNLAARLYRAQIHAALEGNLLAVARLEAERSETGWATLIDPNHTGRPVAFAFASGEVGTTALSRMAEHRCVRVLVALHRQWIAAGGLPDDLSALVPRYLPEVPADPYAPGQPLRWDKAKRVVYSLGPKMSAPPPDFSDNGKPSAAGWFKMVAPGGLGVRFRRPEEGPDVPVR